MNYGRVNHTENPQQEIFICYVLEKLRPIKSKVERQRIFYFLMGGRADTEIIKEEVIRRWKTNMTTEYKK